MKTLNGIVTATKMNNTIMVEVTRRVPHPIYKKLLKRTKKYKVDSTGTTLTVGQAVTIVETRPISKDKHFRVLTENKPEAVTKKEPVEKQTRKSKTVKGGIK